MRQLVIIVYLILNTSSSEIRIHVDVLKDLITYFNKQLYLKHRTLKRFPISDKMLSKLTRHPNIASGIIGQSNNNEPHCGHIIFGLN